ncbi:hypothetical protein GCM10009740_03370 [Terrabacter terrae]|uniref:Uncharacterized protein n=1 Tax=Terrabacter terrae TaxID=318434 RepID=A0ABN2TSN0_9MICO
MSAVWSRYRAILLIAVLAGVAIAGAGLSAPLRALAVVAVIGLVPGVALLPWLPASGSVQRVVIAVAISLSLTAILSESLAIAGVWSADLVIVGVAGLGIGAILCRRWAP